MKAYRYKHFYFGFLAVAVTVLFCMAMKVGNDKHQKEAHHARLLK